MPNGIDLLEQTIRSKYGGMLKASQALGISRNLINQWRTGMYAPKEDTVRDLATRLELDPDEVWAQVCVQIPVRERAPKVRKKRILNCATCACWTAGGCTSPVAPDWYLEARDSEELHCDYHERKEV